MLVAVWLPSRTQGHQFGDSALRKTSSLQSQQRIEFCFIDGEKQQQNIDCFGLVHTTPIPVCRCVLVCVTENPGTVLGRHSFEKRARKSLDRISIQSQMIESFARKCHI